MQKWLEYKALSKAKEKYTESELRDSQLNSQAYKILLNGGYGLMDYKFVKYENLHAAELVTRYGRYTISEIRKIASDMFVWD
jgi:DNA polymerase elongation subunit (family B)